MRRYNKRSKMFSLGLAIVLLLVLLEIFYLVNSRMQDLKGRAAIGANDIALFAAIQENEKSMIYGEVGFGLAFQQSLYNIAKGGGTAEESDCGKFIFFNLWRQDKDYECYPVGDNVKEGLKESTLDSLNSYLSKNPYIEFSGRYRNNHEISIEQKGDRLIARAHAFSPEANTIICNYGYDPSMIFEGDIFGMKYKKVVSSSEKRTGPCGRIYYPPSYRKEIKFNMNDFDAASSAAKAFADDVQQCIDEGNTTRESVFDNLPKHPKISLDCTAGITEVFYSFVDNYRRNVESPTSDCRFYYTPPQLIDVDRAVEFRLKIISEGENTTIMVDEVAIQDLINRLFIHDERGFNYKINAKGPYLAEYYNDPENPYELTEEIQYAVTYDNEGKLEKQELNFGEGGLFSADWDLPGNIMFYKERPGKVVFVDSDNYAEFNEVRPCTPQMENTFAFCYDTENKAMAYDEESEEWAVHPIKIMFALSFPESEPATAEEPAVVEQPTSGDQIADSTPETG